MKFVESLPADYYRLGYIAGAAQETGYMIHPTNGEENDFLYARLLMGGQSRDVKKVQEDGTVVFQNMDTRDRFAETMNREGFSPQQSNPIPSSVRTTG